MIIKTFSAKIQAKQNEIEANLNPGIKAEIESKDDHPFYQAFCTLHEGKGRPTMIGKKAVNINFPREAIKTVKKCVRATLQAFADHQPGTNSTYQRPAFGKIAGHYEKNINGKLGHVAIFYHPPEIRAEAKNFDSCSHEGEWLLKEENGEVSAVSMESFTGVALLRGNETPPALKGALKIGTLQAHEHPGNGEPGNLVPPGKGIKETIMDLSTLSISEFNTLVKAEINRRQMWPSDFFNLDVIKRDRNFSTEFEKMTALSSEVNTLKTQVETLTGEKTALEQERNKATATPRLQEKIKDHPEKLAAYISREYGNSKLTDYTDKGLDEFIKNSVGRYEQDIKFFGITKGDNPPLPPGGDPPEDKEIDYTDPLQNPLTKDLFKDGNLK